MVTKKDAFIPAKKQLTLSSIVTTTKSKMKPAPKTILVPGNTMLISNATKTTKKSTPSNKSAKPVKPVKAAKSSIFSKPAKAPKSTKTSKPLKKPTKKQPRNASVEAQKAWQGFSPKLKKELRRALPDHDRDGVPTGFDCRPRNRKRQESFLPEDADYVNNVGEYELGEVIGEGTSSDTYSIKGNDNIVMKVPRGYMDNGRLNPSDRQQALIAAQKDMDDEAKNYTDYNLENEALFIPTRVVNIGSSDILNGGYTGLVRPKVQRPGENNHVLTDEQIEQVRQKVIALSHKGFVLGNGLQVGIDRSGRALLFNTGRVSKVDSSDSFSTSAAFAKNEIAWELFLRYWLKKMGADPESQKACLEKYGTINPKEKYGAPSSSNRFVI